ncbi:MAG: 50S ribosomal protein L9 [Puniceicoccales bacterium]|jgi:large subunit ribosomal protein L9|nr:50S ribosomal protein L9 [Puniceicoccales bacterium]
MATQKILLLKPIPKLGKEGECVRVRAGYARNFLTVYGWAIPVDRANENRIKSLLRKREEREAKEKDAAVALAQRIGELRIAVAVHTGEKGKLFGSVTAKEILAALADQGIAIEKDALGLAHPIKELGQHCIDVKLHSDVIAKLAVEVVSENPVVGLK